MQLIYNEYFIAIFYLQTQKCEKYLLKNRKEILIKEIIYRYLQSEI